MKVCRGSPFFFKKLHWQQFQYKNNFNVLQMKQQKFVTVQTACNNLSYTAGLKALIDVLQSIQSRLCVAESINRVIAAVKGQANLCIQMPAQNRTNFPDE